MDGLDTTGVEAQEPQTVGEEQQVSMTLREPTTPRQVVEEVDDEEMQSRYAG